MDIKILHEKSSSYKKFEETEWKGSDIEHYGLEIEWVEKHLFLEARIGTDLAGVLQMKCTSGVVYIEALLVNTTHRGKGVGRQLMKSAEEQAKQLKAHKIFLDTGKGWDSEGFYLKLGFIKTGLLEKHYNKQDFVIFTKFLNV